MGCDISGQKRKLVKAVKAARILAAVMFAAVFTLCILSFTKYYGDRKKTEDAMQGLRALAVEPAKTVKPVLEQKPAEPEYKINERFLPLYTLNNQLSGWIKIEGTVIDYPVMHSPEDEQFYLRHNFEGEDDKHGLPFLDARCTIAPKNQVQIVYGHNIKSGIMFHDLLLYEDEEFYKEHRYIQYDTIYEEGIYQIVAAFRFDANKAGDDPEKFHFHRFIEFKTERRFKEYKEEVMQRALYDTGIEFDYMDNYLIMATCEYSKKNSRMVLLAKQVDNF